MEKNNRSGFAVLIILIGIVILLVNMDILKIEMFWGIIHLWPLLLVLAGLSLLFKKVRYFDVVLWLIFFGIVIGYSYLNMDRKAWFIGDPIESVTYKETIDTDSGRLDLDISTGNVQLMASETPQIIYSLPNIGIQENSFEVSLDDSRLKIKDNAKKEFTTTFQNRNYTFNIPKDVLWHINLDGAVFNSDIDLSDLKIENFDMDFAVGEIKVTVGENTMGNYNFDFAVGSLTIDLPDNANALIHIDGGINSTDLPEGYIQVGEYYQSKYYDETGEVINIKIDLAVGRVEIK